MLGFGHEFLLQESDGLELNACCANCSERRCCPTASTANRKEKMSPVDETCGLSHNAVTDEAHRVIDVG